VLANPPSGCAHTWVLLHIIITTWYYQAFVFSQSDRAKMESLGCWTFVKGTRQYESYYTILLPQILAVAILIC
jgi:hypothetical protein